MINEASSDEGVVVENSLAEHQRGAAGTGGEEQYFKFEDKSERGIFSEMDSKRNVQNMS